MTRRRIVEPGITWALSRRTTRRHFLLNPDEARQMEQSYWYCLGHAAQSHGVAVTTKASRKWPEEVFNKRSTRAHALLTPEATIEALAYLIANPVEAMAVRYAKDWPGAQTLPRDLGRRVVKVRRPPHYFDPDNPDWPEVIELRLQMPTALECDYGTELAQRRVAERVKDREHRAWQESKRTGISFVGSRRVLRQAPTKRARSDMAADSW